MLYLITYDIADPKRLNKTAKALLDYGSRVQYSVFECLLKASELSALKIKLNKIIDPHYDSVRIYSFCSACAKKIEIIGTGSLTRDPNYYFI